jgi:hypothetical protein
MKPWVSPLGGSWSKDFEAHDNGVPPFFSEALEPVASVAESPTAAANVAAFANWHGYVEAIGAKLLPYSAAAWQEWNARRETDPDFQRLYNEVYAATALEIEDAYWADRPSWERKGYVWRPEAGGWVLPGQLVSVEDQLRIGKFAGNVGMSYEEAQAVFLGLPAGDTRDLLFPWQPNPLIQRIQAEAYLGSGATLTAGELDAYLADPVPLENQFKPTTTQIEYHESDPGNYIIRDIATGEVIGGPGAVSLEDGNGNRLEVRPSWTAAALAGVGLLLFTRRRRG